MSNLQLTISYDQARCHPSEFLNPLPSFSAPTQCPSLFKLKNKWNLLPYQEQEAGLWEQLSQKIQYFQNCALPFLSGDLKRDKILPFTPSYISDPESYDFPKYFSQVSLKQRALCFPNAHYLSLVYEGKAAQLVDYVTRKRISFFSLSDEFDPEFLEKSEFHHLPEDARFIEAFRALNEDKTSDPLETFYMKVLVMTLMNRLGPKEIRNMIRAVEDLGFNFDFEFIAQQMPQSTFLKTVFSEGFLEISTYCSASLIQFFQNLSTKLFTEPLGLEGFSKPNTTDSSFLKEFSLALLERKSNSQQLWPFLHALYSKDEKTVLEYIHQKTHCPSPLLNEPFDFVVDHLIKVFKGFSQKISQMAERYEYNLQPEIALPILTFFTEWLDFLIEQSTTLKDQAPLKILIHTLLFSPPLQAFLHEASDEVLQALVTQHDFGEAEAYLFLSFSFVKGNASLFDYVIKNNPNIIDLAESFIDQQKKVCTSFSKNFNTIARSIANAMPTHQNEDFPSVDSKARQKSYQAQNLFALLALAFNSLAHTTDLTNNFSALINLLPPSSTRDSMLKIEDLLADFKSKKSTSIISMLLSSR